MRGILGQADDAPFGDICHRRLAEERQQVVLTQAVERDVLYNHHLAVVDIEDGVVDQSLGIDVVAGGQLAIHAAHATGSFLQAGSVGILAHLDQNLTHGGFDRIASVAVDREWAFADLLLDLFDQLSDVRRQGPIHHRLV